MRLRFHGEARAEFIAATEWYGRERPGLAEEFVDQVAKALATIADHPHAWPVVARDGDTALRRLVLPRFPYSVIFATEGAELYVVAVAHGKRRPGYWRGRMTARR